ncbi:MAG TPA: DUF6209 family protein [Kofleriaceae bacterium]|jgi:hypothetical protein
MIRLPYALALVVVAGCATDAADSSTVGGGGKADGQLTTLSFDGDFSESADGAIAAGSAVRIAYDLDRLQECRTESGGSDKWGASGYASFDGGEPEVFAVSQIKNGRTTAVTAELQIPAHAHSLQLWFASNDSYGCVGYDSNDGANYAFDVEAQPGGTVLSFDADYSQSQSGAIRGGDKVVVHYDPARLSDCAAESGGMAQYSITANYRVDGGAVKQVPVTRADGEDLVASDPEITVKNGSDLELWFETNNRYGCHAYDSAGGANYHFGIE